MPAEVTTPSDREVRVTRKFNAPRQLVWDAHTKPELVQKWMTGYPGWDLPVCEMDVRVGGRYRWAWKNQQDGTTGFGFHGTFTEVNAPSKLAYEEFFDPGDLPADMPMDPCIVSLELSEANGATTLVCTMKFSSKETRDAAVATGMTDGMEVGYARLDDMFKQAA